MRNDFLVELGCEELPPKAMQTLITAFAKEIKEGLIKESLTFEEVVTYASPRRLAVKVTNLLSKQESQKVLRKGPSLKAAFTADGDPTPALMGFARSCGISNLDNLITIKEAKGEWLAFESTQEGLDAETLLPEIIKLSIKKLPIPKPMRWGNLERQFVRPVHWLVMLYGNDIVPATILEIPADRYTQGHRFQHPGKIKINHPDDYESILEKAFVIADFSKRRALIKKQIASCAEISKGFLVENEALLNEVTAIVEWPNAVLVPFDIDFLSVPKEALIESMASHQKCFSLKDKNDTLLPFFITVANISPVSNERIIKGNEKVMRARLSDAMFFYDNDKKSSLAHKAKKLSTIVFQKELGTVEDKINRVSKLALFMSSDKNIENVQRAVLLSKSSLVTEMVGEFPSLQGVMGYYYAKHDGEPDSVAQALVEQYLPKFSGDALPSSDIGAVLAVSDRIDTLTGIFGINQKPTGVKDPFQLRRLALAVIRILIDKDINLTIKDLINVSITAFDECLPNENTVSELMKFISDRLYTYLTNSLDLRSDVVKAVLIHHEDKTLSDIVSRCQALQKFVLSDNSLTLIQGFKRVSNLLKASELSLDNNNDVNVDLLIEPQEKILFEAIQEQKSHVKTLLLDKNYDDLLLHLSILKQPVDAFFEHVMVNSDELTLKVNRLSMLKKLRKMFIQFADFSLLQEG